MVSASEFKNKTVFVTGSSSGIGRGVVKSFASLGARVAINYPNEQDKPNAELVLKEIFSLGVIIFTIVVGIFPFSEAARNDRYYGYIIGGRYPSICSSGSRYKISDI